MIYKHSFLIVVFVKLNKSSFLFVALKLRPSLIFDNYLTHESFPIMKSSEFLYKQIIFINNNYESHIWLFFDYNIKYQR
jgi:hypothetical protein